MELLDNIYVHSSGRMLGTVVGIKCYEDGTKRLVAGSIDPECYYPVYDVRLVRPFEVGTTFLYVWDEEEQEVIIGRVTEVNREVLSGDAVYVKYDTLHSDIDADMRGFYSGSSMYDSAVIL